MGGDPDAFQGDRRRPAAIPHPFLLSQYPVTVAQFQAFVEAGGYSQREYWSAEGWRWRTEGRVSGRELDRFELDGIKEQPLPIRRPRRFPLVFQTPNHPQVGVCLFEVLAYCAWLNSAAIRSRLLADGAYPAGATFRPPTEAEWEMAARHPDGRIFPWGSESSEAALTARCNWGPSGLERTSAVGLFPLGRSACQAHDLAGNVWEWCLDLKESPDSTGVLRGGSWRDGHPEFLHAAGRFCDRPGLRDYYAFGFRLVMDCGV